MRVLLAAVGTRGDIQPALALALELRRLGHESRLCISPNFVAQARELGFEATPMGVEMRMSTKAASYPARLTAAELRRLRESMPDLVADQFDTLGTAVEGCDLIVGANAHQYAAPSVAERAGISCVTAVYAPVAIPTPELAPPPAPGQTEEGMSRSNEERWRAVRASWNERALDRVNTNRERLGLGPISDVLDHALGECTWLAADEVLAPVPATPGRDVFQTGAWVFPDERPLPADLEEFLDRGEPPVLVGFGSMPVAAAAAAAAIDAARTLGRRVVVSKGWAELEVDDDRPDCLAIGDVNHSALLPRVAAFVHHGGAGTTAAATRAAVPQVIAPLFGDQFYWGSRVAELGIGSTVSHAALEVESLAGALQKALAERTLIRAREMASKVGVGGAEVAARRLVQRYGAARSAEVEQEKDFR